MSFHALAYHIRKKASSLILQKIVFLLIGGIFTLSLYADSNSTLSLSKNDSKQSSINFYIGQGVYDNLDKVIKASVGLNDFHYASTFISSLSYSKSLYCVYKHFKIGYELDLAKHYGIQSNSEVGILVLFIFPRLLPDNPWIECDFIYGEGLSYAIGTPYFENLIIGDSGPYYHLQSFLVFDIDLYLPRYQKWHLFFRNHHRSSVFGLFPGPLIKSNFVGFGLKYLI